jgi:hypothetical protein
MQRTFKLGTLELLILLALLPGCATPQKDVPVVAPMIPSPPAVPMPPPSGTYSEKLIKKRDDWQRRLIDTPQK